MADIIKNGPFISKLVKLCAAIKQDAQLLHNPDIAFFKDFLVSMGATVPSAQKEAPPG